MAVLLGAAGVARWRPTATAHRPRRPAAGALTGVNVPAGWTSTAIPLGFACATAGVETQQHILTGLESR
jgi:hypothetical protein